MITKITKITWYSYEVLDFNCNDFGFTFNIGVSYLGMFIRHHWNKLTINAMTSQITTFVKQSMQWHLK